MTLPWFRMYSEFASDPVIQALAFEDQRHYVVILCLKCNGTLDRDISTANRNRIIYRGLGLDPTTAEEAKRRLIEMALIDDKWNPKGWEKRQYKSDVSTPRVRKSRKTKGDGNVSETLPRRFGNGPDTDTDTDTEREGVNAPRSIGKRFQPPTAEEVREYVSERGSRVDPEQFCDFYAAKGWKVGNTAMKDWKAAVRTWEKRGNSETPEPRPYVR